MKLKYILITLFLRRAFSRPFIIILLACHRGPRAPRTYGAKVERGGEPHNLFTNISRKNPVFGKKWPFFGKSKVDDENNRKNSKKYLPFRVQNSENYQDFTKRW